jgi:hypothetical protein
MKTLEIEWRHLDVSGETCNRCNDTGGNLIEEVKRLKSVLQPKGIEVKLIETKLDENQTSESNSIFLNGIAIEEILKIKVSENYCDSCSDLLGAETYCRTVAYDGNEYEDIPVEAIRDAAYKILGIEGTKIGETPECTCSCKNCC